MKTGLISYGLAIMAILTTLPGHAGSIDITFNKDEQLLGVTANQASLTEILKQISAKTGISIRIDPAIERTASFAIKAGPLEKVLGKLARNLSYVISYENRNNKRFVAGLDILPEGKQDSRQLLTIQNISTNGADIYSDGGILHRFTGNPVKRLPKSSRPIPKSNTLHEQQSGRVEDFSQTESQNQSAQQQTTSQPTKTPVDINMNQP